VIQTLYLIYFQTVTSVISHLDHDKEPINKGNIEGNWTANLLDSCSFVKLSSRYLILLLIWVDKENLIEFLFNSYTLLIQLHSLYTNFPYSSCDPVTWHDPVISWYVTMICDICYMALSYTFSLCSKSKRKWNEKEYK